MTAELLLPDEAVFLAEPSVNSAGKCVQAGLLTLLGRGHIAIQPKEGWLGASSLRLANGDGQPIPVRLETLKSTVRPMAGSVARSNEVMRSLQKMYGLSLHRYVHDILAPVMISRGLIVREDARFLGLIPYIRYRRTAAGEARAKPLLELAKDLGDMRRLVRKDPERAVQLARAAGVLLILSPAARSQVERLKAIVQQGAGTDGGTAYVAYSSDDEDGGSGWDFGAEIGDLSGFADATAMLDGLSSIGDFTGGDGGGGDGGGDGGGGGD